MPGLIYNLNYGGSNLWDKDIHVDLLMTYWPYPSSIFPLYESIMCLLILFLNSLITTYWFTLISYVPIITRVKKANFSTTSLHPKFQI